MIIAYHEKNKLLKVTRNEERLSFSSNTIAAALVDLADAYPQDWIIWCASDLESKLNKTHLPTIFHHHKIMASYNVGRQYYIPTAIGYVEESPFIKVNKKVSYPTWLMSSEVGGVHATVLNKIGTKLVENNLDYFLNSLAKLGMLAGLFCYSEPALLTAIPNPLKSKSASSNYVLFRFVKQHYKKRWLLLLALNLALYEKRLPILPFCYALFFKNRKNAALNVAEIAVCSHLKTVVQKTIDVIIPTIGRKQYLYDVLKDLAQQTHLPHKVIIVEQNPLEASISELDYLTTESWPFTIKHIFTHQAGACNARNLALAEVESEWVFLNDDDNRFDKDLIERFFDKANQYGAEVISTVYLQPQEQQFYNTIHQTGIFGSGNSFVKTTCLSNISFDKALEFGYGEDTDFGLQLRNQGHDIIFFPDLKITHLKAPMGGFRIKTPKKWESEHIQPKPSPTILYVKRKHYSNEQLNCYKVLYFLKSLKGESVFTLFRFCRLFQQRWYLSKIWSEKI